MQASADTAPHETDTQAASAPALDAALGRRVGAEGMQLGDINATEHLLGGELSQLRYNLQLSRQAGADARNRGNGTLHSARLAARQELLDSKLANISSVLMRTGLQQESARAATQATEQDYEQLLVKKTQSKVVLIATQATASTAAAGAEQANDDLQKARSLVLKASLRHRMVIQAQSEAQLARDSVAAGRNANSSEPVTELDKAINTFPTHIPDYETLNHLKELEIALEDTKARELRAMKFANSQGKGKQSTQLMLVEAEIQHVAAERAAEEGKTQVDQAWAHEDALMHEHQMADIEAKELMTEKNATLIESNQAECVVSEWSDFTDCPTTCAHAHERPVISRRTRAVVALPEAMGSACPGDLHRVLLVAC